MHANICVSAFACASVLILCSVNRACAVISGQPLWRNVKLISKRCTFLPATCVFHIFENFRGHLWEVSLFKATQRDSPSSTAWLDREVTVLIATLYSGQVSTIMWSLYKENMHFIRASPVVCIRHTLQIKEVWSARPQALEHTHIDNVSECV